MTTISSLIASSYKVTLNVCAGPSVQVERSGRIGGSYSADGAVLDIVSTTFTKSRHRAIGASSAALMTLDNCTFTKNNEIGLLFSIHTVNA